ncbi:hypothetical protein N5I27_05935 [Acinetobacter johnsonii]|uniref:Uncharacterized protein n=1 Tax=Acinetobacter johnsonii TaxID=40214 RepID=A0AA42QNM8_ACIJO|nr:hypothetical protein [Acinetobacter johnsonii]MDH1437944.1 hypothetical protein [Acinetobacter johnsonii]
MTFARDLLSYYFFIFGSILQRAFEETPNDGNGMQDIATIIFVVKDKHPDMYQLLSFKQCHTFSSGSLT